MVLYGPLRSVLNVVESESSGAAAASQNIGNVGRLFQDWVP